MMNNEGNSFGRVVLIVALFLIVGLIGYIFYNKYTTDEKISKLNSEIELLNSEIVNLKDSNFSGVGDEISVYDLYGTYLWTKNFKKTVGGVENVDVVYKVELTLNSDGTAIYMASDGMSAEQTRGSYKYENGKIIYIREYNNYPSDQSVYNDKNSKTEIFDVINTNTLQITYKDQLTELKKQ